MVKKKNRNLKPQGNNGLGSWQLEEYALSFSVLQGQHKYAETCLNISIDEHTELFSSQAARILSSWLHLKTALRC